MVSSIINSIFATLQENEPYTKLLGTAASMVTNYRQNIRIENAESNIEYIKSILGLSTVRLSEDALKIISVFVEKNNCDSLPIDNTWIEDINEFTKSNLDMETIERTLLELESYGFIEVKRCTSNFVLYSLSFSIFSGSDLLQQMYNGALSYTELLHIVINHLCEYEEDIYTVDKLADKLSLDAFLLNPIIEHLSLEQAITPYGTITNNQFTKRDIMLKKPDLLRLKRKIDFKSAVS